MQRRIRRENRSYVAGVPSPCRRPRRAWPTRHSGPTNATQADVCHAAPLLLNSTAAQPQGEAASFECAGQATVADARHSAMGSGPVGIISTKASCRFGKASAPLAIP
mmetsp:Transcript_50045/g.160105  ORF Transcript_50045/g.160105 Transcript_50045/m.160105 type:complete len:107 (+) Transcript_50045:1276-1596(+)